MIHDFVVVCFVVVDHKEVTGSLSTEGLVRTLLLNSLFVFLLCIC